MIRLQRKYISDTLLSNSVKVPTQNQRSFICLWLQGFCVTCSKTCYVDFTRYTIFVIYRYGKGITHFLSWIVSRLSTKRNDMVVWKMRLHLMFFLHLKRFTFLIFSNNQIKGNAIRGNKTSRRDVENFNSLMILLY